MHGEEHNCSPQFSRCNIRVPSTEIGEIGWCGSADPALHIVCHQQLWCAWISSKHRTQQSSKQETPHVSGGIYRISTAAQIQVLVANTPANKKRNQIFSGAQIYVLLSPPHSSHLQTAMPAIQPPNHGRMLWEFNLLLFTLITAIIIIILDGGGQHSDDFLVVLYILKPKYYIHCATRPQMESLSSANIVILSLIER